MSEKNSSETLTSRRRFLAAIGGGLSIVWSAFHAKPFVPAQRHKVDVLNVTLSSSGNFVSSTAVIDSDADIWVRGEFQLTANDNKVFLPGTEKTGRFLINAGEAERISATWRVNDVVKKQVDGCIFRILEVDR
jgi:hypothetical protein